MSQQTTTGQAVPPDEIFINIRSEHDGALGIAYDYSNGNDVRYTLAKPIPDRPELSPLERAAVAAGYNLIRDGFPDSDRWVLVVADGIASIIPYYYSNGRWGWYCSGVTVGDEIIAWRDYPELPTMPVIPNLETKEQ